MREYLAIDPMATLLPEEVFLNWCEIRHPHVPKVAEAKKVLEGITAEQRKLVVSRAKALVKQGELLVECGKAVLSAAR